MQSLFNASVSALGAFGVGMQVVADNLANINTADYKAGQIHYATGPGGHGVSIGAISRDASAGPLLPQDTAVLSPDGMYLREGSNVSLEREFVQMTVTEHGYAANAKVVQAYEDVTGVVLNLKV